MNALLLSRDEAVSRAQRLYEEEIRATVETDENIGKLIVIDIETGDYEVDMSVKPAAEGIAAAGHLRAKHPEGDLVALRIGYDAVVSFGGMIRWTTKP